jgi:hypothetical protein
VKAAAGHDGAGGEPALAQDEPPPVDVEVTSGGVNSAISIAVPPMPVEAGWSWRLGRNIAGVIASGLRTSGRFAPLGPAASQLQRGQADAPASANGAGSVRSSW